MPDAIGHDRRRARRLQGLQLGRPARGEPGRGERTGTHPSTGPGQPIPCRAGPQGAAHAVPVRPPPVDPLRARARAGADRSTGEGTAARGTPWGRGEGPEGPARLAAAACPRVALRQVRDAVAEHPALGQRRPLPVRVGHARERRIEGVLLRDQVVDQGTQRVGPVVSRHAGSRAPGFQAGNPVPRANLAPRVAGGHRSGFARCLRCARPRARSPLRGRRCMDGADAWTGYVRRVPKCPQGQPRPTIPKIGELLPFNPSVQGSSP